MLVRTVSNLRLGCAALIVSTITSATAWSQTCRAVQFAPGRSSMTITGLAPAEDVVCYTFDAVPGQTARLNATGRNVIVSVIDVGDARTAFTFRTKAQNKFVVGQLMRSVTPERFSVTLSIR